MPLLRLIAAAWALGVATAFAADGWPLTLRIAAAVVGCAGVALVPRGAPRFGSALFAWAVAAGVAPPGPAATSALFDGREWTALARVDGALRERAQAVSAPVALERAGPAWPAHAVAARLRLVAPSLPARLGPGDRVLFRARLTGPSGRCNPGACDGPWRAAADGTAGTTFVADAQLVARAAGPPTGVSGRLWALRRALRGAIDARLPAEEASLVAALVVGERGAVGAADEERFRAVGVTHLLSVSGLHLAFAAGLLFGAARRLLAWLAPELGRRRPRDRIAAALSLPIVIAYAVLTGAEVATVRAALVVGYAALGVLGTRRVRAVDALAVAALGILVARPASWIDASFQLSFVAAAATISSARPAALGRGPLRRLLDAAWAVCRASAAATLATAPITALHFGQIAPMGLLSNVVAVPLTELAIVPIGLCGAVLELAGWGAPLLHVAGFLASLLLALVRGLSRWAPVIEVAAPSRLLLAACALGAAWVVAAEQGRRLRRVALVACAVAAYACGERLEARLRPRLEVVFLDVGQGDGAVLLLPDGSAVIVDGGTPMVGGDPATHPVVAFLRRRAVRRVRLLVLSHPHPDHAGALAEVVRRFDVDEVWTNGQPSEDPSVRALVAAARARGVRFGAPRALVIDGVALAALAPRWAGALAADPLASENDNSLVLRVEYGGRRLLFAGDVEQAGEAALAGTGPGSVDLLKVPHHGSRTSSSDELLEALRPRWAVASLAAGNRYRFPHPDVVARYRARGIALYRTDRDGAVTFRVARDGAVAIECARPGGCASAPDGG